MELRFLILSIAFAAVGLSMANHQHSLGTRTDVSGIETLGSSALQSGRSHRHFQNANRPNIISSRMTSSSLSEGRLGSSVASATSIGNGGIDAAVSAVAGLGGAPDATGSGLHGTINNVRGNIPTIPFISLPQETRQQGANFGVRPNLSSRNRGANTLSVSAKSTAARTVNTTSRSRRRRIMSTSKAGAEATDSGRGAAANVPGQGGLPIDLQGMGGISGALGGANFMPEGTNGIFSGGQGRLRSGTGIIGPHGTGLSVEGFERDGGLPGGSGALFPAMGLRGMVGSGVINGGGNGLRGTGLNGIVDWRDSMGGGPGFSSGGDSLLGGRGSGTGLGGTGLNGLSDWGGSMGGESGIISSGSKRFRTSGSNRVMGESVDIGLGTGISSGLGRGVGDIQLNSVGATAGGRPLYVIDAQTLAILLRGISTRAGSGGTATTLQGEEPAEMEHEEAIHPTTVNTISRGESRQQLNIGSGGPIQLDGRGTSIEVVSGGIGGGNSGSGQNGLIYGSGSAEGGQQIRISGGGNGKAGQSLVIEAGTLGSKGIMLGGPGSTIDIGGSSLSVPGNATLIIGKSNG